jgi:hypothetical protein
MDNVRWDEDEVARVGLTGAIELVADPPAAHSAEHVERRLGVAMMVDTGPAASGEDRQAHP